MSAPVGGGVSAPMGGVCSRGVFAPGGCLLGGGALWGMSPRGCLYPAGVPARGGGIPACTEADPPPVDRITDMSKKRNLGHNFFEAGNNDIMRIPHLLDTVFVRILSVLASNPSRMLMLHTCGMLTSTYLC